MELFKFILHIDVYLANIIALFGHGTYVFLFIIIFAETGLVVTPFLPGDSLIFATGAFAGGGLLNVWICYAVIITAAILGDTVNYLIGYRVGPKVFSKENSWLFKKAYLDKAQAFYEKHGGKTIILARFIPIIRTFAPFVAGIGKMKYRAFIFYNIAGAFVWTSLFLFAGYYFGSIPFVQEHFEYVIIVIILISVIPILLETIKARRKT